MEEDFFIVRSLDNPQKLWVRTPYKHPDFGHIAVPMSSLEEAENYIKERKSMPNEILVLPFMARSARSNHQ